jgi:hypothetical protein
MVSGDPLREGVELCSKEASETSDPCVREAL